MEDLDKRQQFLKTAKRNFLIAVCFFVVLYIIEATGKFYEVVGVDLGLIILVVAQIGFVAFLIAGIVYLIRGLKIKRH